MFPNSIIKLQNLASCSGVIAELVNVRVKNWIGSLVEFQSWQYWNSLVDKMERGTQNH